MLRKIDIYVQRYIFSFLTNCVICNKYDTSTSMSKCSACHNQFCLVCKKNNVTYRACRDEQARHFCTKCIAFD